MASHLIFNVSETLHGEHPSFTT